MITIPNAYIPIQNDSDRISNNERDFIINQACSSLKADHNNNMTSSKLQEQHHNEVGCYRIDGRSLNQIRPIQLHLTRGDNIATCTIRWGISTRITCTVLGELVIPTVERPNEGIIIISVDIASSSNTSYRHTTPLSNNNYNSNASNSFLPNADQQQKLLSNHILRCIERLIIQGGVLDPEALCVTVSKHVWYVMFLFMCFCIYYCIINLCVCVCRESEKQKNTLSIRNLIFSSFFSLYSFFIIYIYLFINIL